MPDFRFDDRSMRYRNTTTGRYISERSIRDAVDAVVRLSGERLADLARQFRAGTIDARAFLDGMMAEIKSAQIAAALAAYGGREQLSNAKWGYVGYRIREQYSYLYKFMSDILNGRQRLNGRTDARARMYAQAARQTFTAIQRRERMLLGFTHEQNVLGESEHCPDCVGESDLGSVPIGTLSLPGTRRCRVNCACVLEYRDQRATAVEAA